MMKPVTEKLIEAILLDTWPSPATCCDFGLDGPDAQAKFGALQHGFKAEEFTAQELDDALGSGPALTALVKKFGCPLVFVTAYDGWGDWDEDDDDEGVDDDYYYEPDVDEAQEWHDFDPDC